MRWWKNCFRYHGAERVYVGTVEGFPHLDYVLARLYRHGVTLVHLAPLMIVAGDHAQNDLAGDADDSWKSRLLGEDYSVEVHMTGLGELNAVAEISSTTAAQPNRYKVSAPRGIGWHYIILFCTIVPCLEHWQRLFKKCNSVQENNGTEWYDESIKERAPRR